VGDAKKAHGGGTPPSDAWDAEKSLYFLLLLLLLLLLVLVGTAAAAVVVEADFPMMVKDCNHQIRTPDTAPISCSAIKRATFFAVFFLLLLAYVWLSAEFRQPDVGQTLFPQF
jgi:uncharacterized BrkB/YihY/UPF0761 family membrane protein